MKKLFKIVIFIMLLNSAIGLGIIGYAFFSVIDASVKDTGISVVDLINLSSDNKNKLEENMLENSSKEGKEFAEKFENILSNFTVKKVDYSKVPATPYPYDDPSDKIKAASDEGTKDGMKILEESKNK